MSWTLQTISSWTIRAGMDPFRREPSHILAIVGNIWTTGGGMNHDIVDREDGNQSHDERVEKPSQTGMLDDTPIELPTEVSSSFGGTMTPLTHETQK